MSNITVTSDNGLTATVTTAAPLVATVSSPTATTYNVGGAMAGPAGPTGATGVTGAAGVAGATGATGSTGAAGTNGADGLTTSVNGVTQVAGAITLTQDNIGDGTTYKQYSATEKTKLAAISGTNTGDQTTITGNAGTATALSTGADRTKLDGIAAGATANSSDATLEARANHTGTQVASTISDFSTAADARITAAAGVSIASLTAGKIPSAQIPVVALATVQTAASQVAQLALTAQEGDVVVRTDLNQTYMHNSGSAGTMADYTLLNTPTDSVTSVAGKTGVVTLVEGDIASLTTDLALKAPLASPALTGVPTAPTAAVSTNTTQLATTAFVLANGGTTPDASTTVKGKATLGASGGAATFDSDAAKLPLTGGSLTGPLDVTVSGASTSTPITATFSSSDGNHPAFIAKNGTSFAQAGNIIKAQMLNGSDSGDVVKLENAGSGNYITADAAFTVAKSGAITSGGVAVPTISSTSTLTNKTMTSPALTGVPTAPTASPGANSTQVATTAYADAVPDKSRTVTATVGVTNSDYTTLAAAITAMPSGGEIKLRAGTYVLTTKLSLVSNLTITGEGVNTIIQQGNAANINPTMIEAASGSTNITLKNFQIDGNSANNATYGRGITLIDTTNSLIQDITIINTRDHAINVRGTSKNNLVKNITATNLLGAAVCLSNGATYNTADNIHTVTASNSGVYITGASHSRVMNSYSEATYYGFDVFNSTDTSLDNCQVLNPTYDQFHIEDSQDIVYTKCLGQGGARDGMAVYSSNLAAMRATNLVISQSIFNGAGHYGINLAGANTGIAFAIDSVSISDCDVTNSTAFGIYAAYTNGLSIQGCIVDGNGGSTYDGIRLDTGVTNAKIGGGNQIINNGAYPLRLNDNTVNNIEIGANHFLGNGTDVVLNNTTGFVSSFTAKADIVLDGVANRQVTTAQATASTGKNLTVSAGAAPAVSTNTNGGILALNSGQGTGTASGSAITFSTAAATTTGQALGTVTEHMRILSNTNGKIIIGATSVNHAFPTDGITFASASGNRGLAMNRHTTSNTAGNSLTVAAGGTTLQSTNKNGGTTIISAPISTGSGTANVRIDATPATTNTLGTIASVTKSAEGSGYTAADVLSITSGGGTGATATVGTVAVAGQLNTITISAAGTGYIVGDVLTIVGGTSGTATVSTVDINGAILTLALTMGGSGYTAGTATVTGGTGTSATLTTTVHATGGILTVSITAAGTGYVLTTGATTTGGTGTGATLNIVPWDNTDNAPATVGTFSGTGLVIVGKTTTDTFKLTTTPTNGYLLTSDASGNGAWVAPSGGTGTVTSASVVTANGVSGSVATATTTPAITLTLGAITPTTVNAITLSGSSTPTLAVTGTTTVSGPNTGDQTSVSGNAGTVTTNANLTGVITSSGNATSIASQTGTGTKFVTDTSPTLVTPNIGAATATSLSTATLSTPTRLVMCPVTDNTNAWSLTKANGTTVFSRYDSSNLRLRIGDGSAPTTILDIAGPIATAYAAKTTTYTITATDSVIDCTTGTFTVTLPTAVGCTGRQYVIKNSGTGAITVACNGAQTIDGVTTSVLGTQYQSLTVVSNNANWIII